MTDDLFGKPLTVEDLYIQCKTEDMENYRVYANRYGYVYPLRLIEPYPELEKIVLHELYIPSKKNRSIDSKRFVQWENNPDSNYFIDTYNQDLSYCAANSNDCKNIVELLNKLHDEKVEMCNYIQTRINESCNPKVLSRFVNSAFLLEEGTGYKTALSHIKKGLMKRGLWQTTIKEEE